MCLTGTGDRIGREGEKEGENDKKREFREEEEEEEEGDSGTAGQREEGHILFVKSDHF